MLQNEIQPIPAKIRKNKSSTFSTDLAAAAASKSEQVGWTFSLRYLLDGILIQEI